jgi:ribosomal protein S18 acetylase RimI-like enzyme
VDDEFLYAVYAGTRGDEVGGFGWDPSTAEAFLRMQFVARKQAYKMQFPTARHSVILFNEIDAGQMIVERTDKQIVLTDIAVLPEFRKKGIATHLIRQLQDEAAASGVPVVLRVDKVNMPAKELYTKLGFAVTGDTQILYEMEWRAK